MTEKDLLISIKTKCSQIVEEIDEYLNTEDKHCNNNIVSKFINLINKLSDYFFLFLNPNYNVVGQSIFYLEVKNKDEQKQVFKDLIIEVKELQDILSLDKYSFKELKKDTYIITKSLDLIKDAYQLYLEETKDPYKKEIIEIYDFLKENLNVINTTKEYDVLDTIKSILDNSKTF
jgi:flagellin-specific chaperone FliS